MVDAAGQLQEPAKVHFRRSARPLSPPLSSHHRPAGMVIPPTTKRPEQTTMMRAKTEQKVKRWKDQRWLIDSVIQAVGMEWDQPRLNYTMYPAGPAAIGDFRTVGLRVRKFADMHREFAAAAHRREVKAQNF